MAVWLLLSNGRDPPRWILHPRAAVVGLRLGRVQEGGWEWDLQLASSMLEGQEGGGGGAY